MFIFLLAFVLLDGRNAKQLNYRGASIQLLNKEMSEFVITNHSIEHSFKELFMGMKIALCSSTLKLEDRS